MHGERKAAWRASCQRRPKAVAYGDLKTLDREDPPLRERPSNDGTENALRGAIISIWKRE